MAERMENGEMPGRLGTGELRGIIDALAEHVIYYAGRDMKIVYANRAAAGSLDREPDDLVGKRCYELWHGRNVPCHRCPVIEALDTGERCERELATPDGRVWLIKGNPVRDAAGAMRGAVEITMEITARRNAEQSLRESEERYRSVVENAHDGISIIDGEGRILFANRFLGQLLGVESSQLVRRLYHGFVPPEESESVDGIVHRLICGESNRDHFETTLLAADGRRILVDIVVTPVVFGGDRAILALVRDITDRRRLEEELQKAEQLESIGVLAGGIAHDFNNILTAVLGNISLAKAAVDPDAARSALRDAERATIRARDLTQQLLTFSRGGEPMTRVARIGPIVEEAAGFALRGSNVRCDFRIARDLRNVEVDEGQISQVVQNLVINAVQAMQQGGAIAVSAENVRVGRADSLPLEPGEYVRVSVEDEGSGIPRDHLDRVFDPYFTTKERGSGLGLATVYSIVRKHGGHVSLVSRDGEGTTVTVYLPATSKPAVERVEEEEQVRVDGMRILLMDDERLVREAAGRMLQRLGHAVVSARDGTEAIDLFRRAAGDGTGFDLVIMDLTIPGGMGGEEAITLLREIDPGVRAIVSSGYSIDPVMANFREFGFDGFIPKPYRLEEMRRAISRVLA